MAATSPRARTAASPASSARATSARALLVTIFGLYARERGGALSVAVLVKLLAALDVDGPAARSLISRLKARGILTPSTVAGSAGYRLTDAGRRLLDEGDRRIYGRPRAKLSDGWLLAVFSVPESQRAQRHSLRTRLAALGFGAVSAGVWIAPAHLAEETGDVLRLHGLDRYVELFTRAGLQGDPTEAVARWWDLDALAGLYSAFVGEYAPVVERWRGTDASTGARGPMSAFADYVRALTAWRRLPYRDPGLPAEALPQDWPGVAAADLFARIRDALAAPAGAFVAAVADQRPDGGPAVADRPAEEDQPGVVEPPAGTAR